MPEIQQDTVCADIVTRTPEMLSIFQYVKSIVKTHQPVLITGESGTGKALIAQCIHALSGLGGPFVQVKVPSEPDDRDFASTLYGHAEGAFDGADRERPGMIEAAEGGTLYIDEIGHLSPSQQIRILRLLQYGEFVPLGASETRKAGVYIVTSASLDLWELQRQEKFRKDLNFKVRTHHVHIPPLRERLNDLPILVDHFMEEAAREMDKRKPTPPRELVTLLQTYTFPGNVKELRNMIFEAVREHKSKVLSLSTFKDHIDREQERRAAMKTEDVPEPSPFQSLRKLPTIYEATELLIREAMRRANGNQSIAARILGISQPALSKRIKGESREPKDSK